MDAGDLRYFEAVARLGSMSRAAAELNTVQSNITSRIRALELELGVELLRRHSRGTELTRAGARLLPYARKTAWVLAEARRAALDDGAPMGALLLGSLETTAALRLAPLIARFGVAFPAVNLSLRVGSNEELIRRVLEFELDGAFVCAPAQHPDLVAEVIFEEELVIAISGHSAVGDPIFSSGCKILVKGRGCAYRDRLEKVIADQGVCNFSTLEFGTLDAIIGCVEAGLGLTMLPRSVLQAAAGAGRVQLRPLPAEIAAVETLFVRRRDALEFSALRAFIDCLHGAAPEQMRRTHVATTAIIV
jgi:DNA-binding transcriptional LysR family regulator